VIVALPVTLKSLVTVKSFPIVTSFGKPTVTVPPLPKVTEPPLTSISLEVPWTVNEVLPSTAVPAVEP